jgi:quinol monooxygenase YgiN
MATFLAHIKVHEGREAEFEILARDLFASTHTSEEQVVRYEYWRGAKPSTYYTHASFNDYLGFLEHQVSSHHERLAADLRDVIADLRIEWVDPVGGASILTTTDHQEPPATAGELATAYAERMPANPAAWWLALRTAGGEAEWDVQTEAL